MKKLLCAVAFLSGMGSTVFAQIPPNNLGQIVEVATPEGILPQPHLLIGWDSTGFIRQANSTDSFKVFGYTPAQTFLNLLNIYRRFSAPTGNDSYEIRYGDSSYYWNGNALAANKLPFAVYSVGPRSAHSQDTTVSHRLCLQRNSAGYYLVYADMALPMDSTYWDMSTSSTNPFLQTTATIRNFRTGKSSVPYTQTTWNALTDSLMPLPGTVIRLVAANTDSSAPVIAVADSMYFLNPADTLSLDIYSFEPATVSLVSAPDHMTIDQDGVIRWNFTTQQGGHRYEVTVKAENSLGLVYNTFTAIAGYACSDSVVPIVNLHENSLNFLTANDGTIAANRPQTRAGMLFHGWDLVYAGGFHVGTKKRGQTGAPDTVTVSEVQFDSEFQPGRILNSGRLDSLITEDPNDPRNGVYVLPDHTDCWPAEAPHSGSDDPLRLSLRDTWTVFNDMGSNNGPGQGEESPKLGLEIQRQTFMFAAYPWNNAVLVRMQIINKSNTTYDSTFFGLWQDADVGEWSNGDLCHIDSSLSLLCTYSAEGDAANIAQATVLLQGPLDLAGVQDTAKLVEIGPSGFFVRERPNHAMRSASAALAGLKQCYGLDDVLRLSIMQGTDCSGNPKPGGPFDLILGNTQRDQHNLISSGPFTFSAGDTQNIWYAYVGALATSDSDAVDTLLNYATLMHQTFQGDMNDIVVGIGDRGRSTSLQDFRLYSNYPNPFNPSTTIKYVLPKTAKVSLKVYNILGQEVRRLVNTRQRMGEHSVVWDGKNKLGRAVSSGVYLYRLEVDGNVKVKKMMVLK